MVLLTDATSPLLAADGTTSLSVVDTLQSFVTPMVQESSSTRSLQQSSPSRAVIEQLAGNPHSPGSVFVTLVRGSASRSFGTMDTATGTVTVLSVLAFRPQCE